MSVMAEAAAGLYPTEEHAAQLVRLGELEHRERELYVLHHAAKRRLKALAEDEITQDDLDWVTGLYLVWAAAWEAAWEALGRARRERGTGA